MEFKNIERFFRTFDLASAQDATRVCLQTMHPLAVMEDTTRLAVTNGHIAVFADMETGAIEYACLQEWIKKIVEPVPEMPEEAPALAKWEKLMETWTPRVCYVTFAKRQIPPGDCFPYPNIMCVVLRPLVAMTEGTAKIFSHEYSGVALKIIEAYNEEKKGTRSFWNPNYRPRHDSLVSPAFYIQRGLCVMIMPLCSRWSRLPNAPVILEINDCLPGFLPVTEDTSQCG